MTISQEDHEALKRRLQSLESEISSVREQLKQPVASVPQTPPPLPMTATQAAPTPTLGLPKQAPLPDPPKPRSFQWKPEIWIGRLGVGLLILGVVFLFQYAADLGWLGPWFRASLGVVIGSVLVFGALRTDGVQKWFRQLLFGAALATWYLTLYAASQIYGLIPGGVTLIAVLGLAVLAYFLSMRERSGTIAFLATCGGMISPLYLLEGIAVSAVELLMTIILSVMAMAYYCRRGGSLQVLLVFLLGGLILIEAGEGNGSFGAKIFIQLAWLAWGFLLFTGTLLRSHYMRTGNIPARLKAILPEKRILHDRSETLATLVMSLLPLIWFMATSGIWNLPKPQAGWVALFLSVIAFVARRKLLLRYPREGFHGKISDILLFHTLLFGLGAIVMVMDGSLQLFCVSMIGFSMLQWAIRNGSVWFRTLGNFLFSASLLWVFVRVINASESWVYSMGASIQCWVDVLVLALALVQSALPWRKSEATVYWISGMPVLLLWFNALVSGYEYSGPVLTLLWSAIAVALLLSGILKERRLWNVTGVLVLCIVMFKLFLYDLATVDAFWRVLLFLLLGAVFLVTSYYIAKSRKTTEGTNGKDNSDGNSDRPVKPPELPPTASSSLEKSEGDGKMEAKA